MNKPISIISNGMAIETELFHPVGTPKGAAVVVAHGSDGMAEPWGAMIREYATELSKRGFVALIPNYFGKAGPTSSQRVFVEMQTKLPVWQQAVGDTLAHAKAMPGISPTRVGLLGFSLGGHIGLRLRGSTGTLVQFFAPELGGIGSSGTPAPHVQIHHGLADLLVPFFNAKNIAAALKLEGTVAEVFSYEGAGHGFAGAEPNNATARRSSKDRTLAFFEKHL